jgi:hypothetical protein
VDWPPLGSQSSTIFLTILNTLRFNHLAAWPVFVAAAQRPLASYNLASRGLRESEFRPKEKGFRTLMFGLVPAKSYGFNKPTQFFRTSMFGNGEGFAKSSLARRTVSEPDVRSPPVKSLVFKNAPDFPNIMFGITWRRFSAGFQPAGPGGHPTHVGALGGRAVRREGRRSKKDSQQRPWLQAVVVLDTVTLAAYAGVQRPKLRLPQTA